MEPYAVFQRFIVLLLTIHGQVQRYSEENGDDVGEGPDTTEFLKNLNVYHSINQIIDTIH